MFLLKAILFLVAAGALIGGVWTALKPGISPRGDVDSSKFKPANAIIGLVASVILFTVMNFLPIIGSVPSNSVGVVTRWGAATGETVSQGFYMLAPLQAKPPFVSPVGVFFINGQTQAYEVKADAASHDLQQVSTTITLNFHPNLSDAVEIYNTVRGDYTERIIAPAVQESLKAATANYTAEQLITQRYKSQQDFRKLLEARMNQFGLTIDAISMTDFKFSDQFNEAIEAKVTQEQQALQAKAKLDQVRYEADQKVVSARAEAQALELQRSVVTPELVRLRELDVQKAMIEKWNGEMPKVMTGGGGTMLNLGNLGDGNK